MFTIIFAKPIILLLSGKGYDGAIIPMQIVMPLILIIGYEQILVIQTLMPLKYDKAILINSIVGACIGILLNILLVSNYKSIGSALVWFVSELSILLTAQYFVWKIIKIKFPLKYLFKNIIDNIPLFAFMLLIYQINKSSIPNMLIGCTIMLIYSIILQYFILKNSIFINLTNKITKKFF